MTITTDMLSKAFKPRDELVTRCIVGETLLVPIRGKIADMQRIFAAEGVGAEVWGSLDGRTPLCTISDDIARKYGRNPADVAADLVAFINDLLENELVTETATAK